MTTTTEIVLAEELQSLHTSYVRAINSAIDSGDDQSARDLGVAHDREKAALVAAHRGRASSRPRWFRRR
ncbi:hypothetical protein FE634_04585 [Nocardioides dongxiaopingii]|uniref:hypothetical protein n=1 Tax=Nocardioides sp. S-1144 TaxID=2582905 RepID=UPI00110DCF3F|nr:hypothetical protein [Nocardioides sp. S-1144]QCW49874.1 hypothetical protein FE634_04585 [Nocardioides sp. S-1144]